MTITLEGEVLTLTAVMVPGKKCSGHMDEIPGGLAYEDQDGSFWCLACAKHMTACTDKDCGHPMAVFAGPTWADDLDREERDELARTLARSCKRSYDVARFVVARDPQPADVEIAGSLLLISAEMSDLHLDVTVRAAAPAEAGR